MDDNALSAARLALCERIPSPTEIFRQRVPKLLHASFARRRRPSRGQARAAFSSSPLQTGFHTPPLTPLVVFYA